MNKVLLLFLCFMISFGRAREDPLLQEDGTPASHQEPRQLKAPGILGNAETDKYAEAVPKYPYIDEKCCKFSTTYRCSEMGTEGLRGHCMPRNATCLGREFFGTKYCVISKHQSCKCCVPTDCEKQTLPPCAKLNGTCIGINDHCNGTSVVSEEFCKKDSRNDTCKCCFPFVPIGDCPCGQNHDGLCRGTYPVWHVSGGKESKGRCMKTCGRGYTPLIDNTCNTTGGKDCKCCDLYNYCGETCGFPNPTSCMCMSNGNQCPKEYCSHPDADLCPEGSCACCHKPTDCTSKLDQCSASKDYCVDKLRGECPKGYSKVSDACSKETGSTDIARGDGNAVTLQNASKANDCDCCKSLECSSIGDRCTGRGSFCIDHSAYCPIGYEESVDCSKPSIINGTIVTILICKCCKPRSAECPRGCFRVGSQCFLKTTFNTSHWEEAAGICKNESQNLAEPQDPQALSQYLTNNYADASYWIGARGTNNDNAAWVSGGVIGAAAPWFANWYAGCDELRWCMYLHANSGCYTSNQCLGCWVCNGDHSYPNPVLRTPLCTCNISI